jgi:DNA-binding protein YbaB
MEPHEKLEKIKAFQNQVREVQNALQDTTISERGELQVVIDGNLQIREIKWLIPVPDDAQHKQLLIKTINRAIVNMNVKLKSSLQQVAQSLNIPAPGF